MVACATARAADAPLVAAAADLQFALQEVADAYARETQGALRLTFGSSGNFARQIEQGAPFEIFFSADETFVARLHAKALTRGAGALYAVGRIALFIPQGSPLKADAGLEGLVQLLSKHAPFKFAIANPEHAPYGRAARQVLERAQLWRALRPHLVLGENAAQAAQFAATDGVVGGIIAYSLALTPQMQARGAYALLPQDAHEPLRQRMALLKNASPAAERFYRYAQSSEARAILRRHGFESPEE